jgi:hypothetical protein
VTRQGAAASAQIYSLVETAKVNGKESYTWLRHVLERLPHTSSVDVYEALLSWNCSTECHVKYEALLAVGVLHGSDRWIQGDHAIPTSTRASDQGILAGRNSRSLSLAKIGTGTKMLKINTA